MLKPQIGFYYSFVRRRGLPKIKQNNFLVDQDNFFSPRDYFCFELDITMNSTQYKQSNSTLHTLIIKFTLNLAKQLISSTKGHCSIFL